MSQFMFLFSQEPHTYSEMSPGQMQEFVQQFGDWIDTMAKAGRFVGGHKLTEEGGRVLERDGASVQVFDGPYSETKEVVGGYVVIEADSYDQAVEFARSCPPLRYGTKLHVREMDTMCNSQAV